MDPVSELPNLYYYRPGKRDQSGRVIEADICIYGGNSGGIAAAVQARRLGKSVAMVEFGTHLGGLTTGGLGATDIGNKAAIGGIAYDFYRRLGKHYGQPEMWTFEPKVASQVFADMLKENDVPVYLEQRLASVKKDGNRIIEITMESGAIFRAKVFIDATYEGDLMAMAGVGYHVGRESNRTYRETLNGIHFGHPNHNFYIWVDPYVKEGDPKSGLLRGVSDAAPGFNGQGDASVQAYNFRMCLTNKPQNRLPFPRPANYDPARYELLLRYTHAGVWDALRLTIEMPNGKTDTNNLGGFSTDDIGMNHEWPDANYVRREALFQEHVNYQTGLMHFLTNDQRLPSKVKEDAKQWGLPKDEFTATGGWTPQLYVREGRRMISDLVMTEHHCRWNQTADNSVGLAAYGMDSHHCRRVVLDGRAVNEGNFEYHVAGPYVMSYQAIVPKKAQCSNLIVPVCVSSTHVAFGSIRMEPVFMVLGQSAATGAAFAIDAGRAVQDIDYDKLKDKLLADKQILDWKNPRV